jgi:hypothetical protein
MAHGQWTEIEARGVLEAWKKSEPIWVGLLCNTGKPGNPGTPCYRPQLLPPLEGPAALGRPYSPPRFSPRR